MGPGSWGLPAEQVHACPRCRAPPLSLPVAVTPAERQDGEGACSRRGGSGSQQELSQEVNRGGLRVRSSGGGWRRQRSSSMGAAIMQLGRGSCGS